MEPFELADSIPPHPPAKPEAPRVPDPALEQAIRLHLKPEERNRLERLLLERLQQRRAELDALWQRMNGHWGYEDGFYRYYHGSFKVYGVQTLTSQAVEFLRQLLPEREMNATFLSIVREGTGKEFRPEHNAEWDRHVRPILEAFAHARFMVEMAVRYTELAEPPAPLPSGYAAFLYLYYLR